MEFYATWCGDCTAMDTQVFTDPKIVKALKRFQSIKVDISDSTDTVKALKKAYHIYGTPMLLFYDSKGRAVKDLSAAGFVNTNRLLKLLNQVR